MTKQSAGQQADYPLSAPILVPVHAPETILAVGGELKSAFCVLSRGEARLSEQFGHLSDPAAYRSFLNAIAGLELLANLRPEIVAADLHPDYAATRYARQLRLRTTFVQHHHAHIVSCMAEHQITGPAIGVACDGTGYGTDGAIWGGEVLVCDEAEFQRAGHLRTFPLPGGDAAAIETWRPAVGLLTDTFGDDWPAAAEEAVRRIEPQALSLIRARLASGPARIGRTSSLGRLFDGVAFLLGVCDRNRNEADAPVALQAAASACAEADALDWRLNEGTDGTAEMDVRPMIRALLDGVRSGRSQAELARAFHETLAVMLAACVERAAERTQLNRVMLSGGCFANRLLLDRLCDLLRGAGRDVYTHQLVSAGDGGLALGQAVAAAARLQRGRL